MHGHEKDNPVTASLPFLSRAFQVFSHSWSGRHAAPAGSAPDSEEKPLRDEPFCGGYNEAFVLQFWTGYNPRH